MSLKISWRRGAAVLALIGLATSPAAAQSSSVPTDQQWYLATPGFASLVNGKSIVVWTRDGRAYEGVFAVSGHTLVMTKKNPITTVPFEQIARIEKSTDRIKFHSLLGLGVGALVGARLAYEVCEGGCGVGTYSRLMLLAGGVGAGIGAKVGLDSNVRNSRDDLIYDARMWKRTLAVAPVVSRTHKGVVVVWTWR